MGPHTDLSEPISPRKPSGKLVPARSTLLPELSAAACTRLHAGAVWPQIGYHPAMRDSLAPGVRVAAPRGIAPCPGCSGGPTRALPDCALECDSPRCRADEGPHGATAGAAAGALCTFPSDGDRSAGVRVRGAPSGSAAARPVLLRVRAGRTQRKSRLLRQETERRTERSRSGTRTASVAQSASMSAETPCRSSTRASRFNRFVRRLTASTRHISRRPHPRHGLSSAR